MINDQGKLAINPCCLMSKGSQTKIDLNALGNNIFEHRDLLDLRRDNQSNIWSEYCSVCKKIEDKGGKSFRQQTSILHEGIKSQGLIDLVIMLDNGCNLACQTCGPNSSTFWESFLEKNNLPVTKKHFSYDDDLVRRVFDPIDLSSLRSVKILGGEPFLGNSTSRFLNYLLSRRPDGDFMVSLHTNGTLPLRKELSELISRFRLVKINISIDGVGARFDYLRWPASWLKLQDNLLRLREEAPVNVMFLIEQTLSIFNLWYFHEVIDWIKNDFTKNRLSDMIEYSYHDADGTYSLDMMTKEYNDALRNHASLSRYHRNDFIEDESGIRDMLTLTRKYDQMRRHDWVKCFPKVADHYQRYL